ncbi:Ras-GAP domain-containing protein [Mycena chlorophos]|uniref:Ras-GAP domain-containing protein n=1 Tax=Mycena chlorophos TaxID=658473 RepID=A0A8H6VXH7_MYCCL|nr:Ras-GAP domain-containing protein [Mycena chlorophos]
MTLASRWNPPNRPSSRVCNESPLPTCTQFSASASDTRSVQSEPIPLDDNCAKYTLSVMIMVLTTNLAFDDYELGPGMLQQGADVIVDDDNRNLRQRHSVSSLRSFTPSMSSSQPSNTGSFKYEPTRRSIVAFPSRMNEQLAKFTGSVIFQFSAFNWPVVLNRLCSILHFLASGELDRKQTPDLIDRQLLAHRALNRDHLISVLQELSALLLTIKEAHQPIAPVLCIAIWNWIDQFLDEFNETIRARRALEGVPERMLDLLYKLNSTPESQTQKQTWPTLGLLNSISSDRLASDLLGQVQAGTGTRGKAARPNVQFSEDMLRHAAIQSKLSEARALVCAVDLRRVASRMQTEGDVALRMVAYDTTPELKGTLRHPMVAGQKPFWDFEEIDVALYAAALTAIFRFSSEQDSIQLFEECLMAERSDAVKVCVVRSMLTLVQESTTLTWQKPLDALLAAAGPRLLTIFSHIGRKRGEVDSNGRPQRVQAFPRIKHRNPQALTDSEVLVLGIAALWRADPVRFGGLHVAVKASMLTNLLTVPPPLLNAPVVPQGREESVQFRKYALPSTLFSCSSNLLRTRTNGDATMLWTSAIADLLQLYLIRNPAPHSQEVRNEAARAPVLVLVEISLLVSLTSESTSIAHMAAKARRVLAEIEAPPRRTSSAGHEAMASPEKRDAILNAVKTKRMAYENLSMFLVSLGGACVQDGVNLKFLASIIPAKYIPDQVREIAPPGPLINKFLHTMTDELVSEDGQMREIARNALGSELSPRLYTRLLRHFDDTMRQISALVSGAELAESHILFVDQFSSVLKLIIESTPPNSESEIMSIDISSTMLSLAGFIARFDAYAASRLRLRFCILCDAVCDRADLLTIRRDNPARQKILDILAEWMHTVPETPTHAPESTAQNELNFACLRTCVKLLERLHLKPAEEAAGHGHGHGHGAGDDTAHSLSRLFHKYSSLLLRGFADCQLDDTRSENLSEAISWTRRNKAAQRDAELRELVITGLTNMVSANSEHGFKQCLPLAYGADLKKRAIFASVFARVISQGTKFEVDVAAPAAVNRHSRLLELVKGSNMVLVMAICETCPQNEMEIMVSVMLNLFDTRSSLMALLKYMIEREVASTEDESQLFRGNTTCTRFLSAFAEIHGYAYLRSLIIPLIKAMAAVPPGHGYELDPDKLDVGAAKAAQNQENVKLVAATLSSGAPADVQGDLCAYLESRAERVAGLQVLSYGRVYLPTARDLLVVVYPSAYSIIHRFISPAIVAPETIEFEIPKDLSKEEQMSIRRGLLILTKIIQNLANNLFFGKEKHMVPLNSFLQENIAIVTRFLSELTKYQPSADEETDEWLGTTTDDTDIIVLHRYFHKHEDKIGKELLSLSKPSELDPSAMSGKHAWDELCGLLVELGTPLDIPKLSSAPAGEHRDYVDLMARYAHRSTEAVRGIFVETDSPMNKPVVFLFCLSKIDVEVLDIELLMYHIFKLTQKYMRRLYNFAAGTPFCAAVRAHSSVIELGAHVPAAVLAKLAYPASLEAEVGSQFSGDVSMRQTQTQTQTRVPITLLVGETHLRITSVRAQPIAPQGLACRATEIIPLADVSDVYNVSSLGHDNTYEFIIRRAQMGTTVYFASPQREAIVKAIRSAKGRLKDTAIPLAERFSRFSNIPATLLHVGMLSVGIADEELSSAGYQLLAAVCTYLNFDRSPIAAPKSGFVPGDPTTFVTKLSESLAEFVPQLTLDFFVNPTSVLFERSGARVRDAVRILADMSTSQPELTTGTQRYVWTEIGKLDPMVIDVVVDELIRSATDGGVGSLRCETVGALMASMTSLALRCKLVFKLRKALTKATGTKVPPRTLPDYPNWTEISTLIRLVYLAGYQSLRPNHNLFYVPDILHLVTLTAGVGPTIVRKSVYGLVVNLLQALYIGRSEDAPPAELLQILEECESAETQRLFGLTRLNSSAEYAPVDLTGDVAKVDAQEQLTNFLLRTVELTAGSRGLLNVWRARWMSLVSSSAFQYSPAVQMRSFTSLGSLLTDADDDFLYQMLVALKMALLQANESDSAIVVTMLRSLAKAAPSLPASGSRYLLSLFWLAVALLQCAHITFYAEAASLLRVSLLGMRARGMFGRAPASVASVLLEGRDALEGVLGQFDALMGLSFDADFAFAMAAVVFKGLRTSIVKDQAEGVLRVLLEVTMRPSLVEDGVNGEEEREVVAPEALGYFIALLPVSATHASYRRLLKECGISESASTSSNGAGTLEEETLSPRVSVPLLGLGLSPADADPNADADPDSALALPLFTASFLSVVLSTTSGSDAESEMLYCLLADIGVAYPEVVSVVLMYDSDSGSGVGVGGGGQTQVGGGGAGWGGGGLQEKIHGILARSANPVIIRAVSTIFRMAAAASFSTPASASASLGTRGAGGSTSTLSTVDETRAPRRPQGQAGHLQALEELGMPGLASNFVFLPPTGGHVTRVMQWIPELLDLLLQP